MGRQRIATVAAVALALTAAGCGDDKDAAGTPAAPAAQEPTLDEAAKSLDRYLRDHTQKLTSSHAEAGQLVNLVEPFEGKLKIYLLASSEVATDEKVSTRVCRIVGESGIAEAEGALVVDVGDATMRRC